MSRNSKSKSNAPSKPRAFRNESEEADWWSSKAGQRFANRILRDSIRSGTVEVSQGVPDPAALQKMFEEAQASMTTPVSIRLENRVIEAARRRGAEEGVGYQTVIKQIVNKELVERHTVKLAKEMRVVKVGKGSRLAEAHEASRAQTPAAPRR